MTDGDGAIAGDNICDSVRRRRRLSRCTVFAAALLHIDLSTAAVSYHQLEESRLRACLGGIGLGTSLLYEYAPAGVDPLSPANPLIFTSAPLVGTGLTTTAKFAIVTKSPLTGFIADSLSSSHFAIELKRLGIDAPGDHRPGAIVGLPVHAGRDGRNPGSRTTAGKAAE